MAVGVGEIADLVDDRALGSRVAGQPALEGAVAILGGQVVEHLHTALVESTLWPASTAW